MMWDRVSSAGGWSPPAQSAFVSLLVAALVFLSPHALGLLLFLLPDIARPIEASAAPLLRMLVLGLEVGEGGEGGRRGVMGRTVHGSVATFVMTMAVLAQLRSICVHWPSPSLHCVAG